MTPLEQCKDTIDRAFQAAIKTGPDVKVDEAGKRLIIDGRWAMKQQGKGWVLICKHAVPNEVRLIKQITKPDDNPEFTYTPVWKASRPIGVILHALMSQWFDTRASEAIFEVTREGVHYGLDSDGEAENEGSERKPPVRPRGGNHPRPGNGGSRRSVA